MRILWFTWKDMRHPWAGGAEVVNERLARMLVRDGHEVTFVVAGVKGGAPEEERDGFRVIRVGSRWTVYWHAFLLYRRRFLGKVDLVIDESNALPFFCARYVRERNIFLVHQLARRVWFYQIGFPLNAIGWLIEPMYLRLLGDVPTITVSESTKRDLVRNGFSPDKVTVIPQAVLAENAEVPALGDRPSAPMMLAFGEARPMKRTHHALRAFEIAKRSIPDLTLVIAGGIESPYGRRVKRMAAVSPYADSIRIVGKVSNDERERIFAEARVLCVTSVKEGWCLVVSEAALRGVPTVAYDVDGVRDSVRDGETGMLVKDGDPSAMAEGVVKLCADGMTHDRMRRAGFEWAKTFTTERSYDAFLRVIKD